MSKYGLRGGVRYGAFHTYISLISLLSLVEVIIHSYNHYLSDRTRLSYWTDCGKVVTVL